MNNRRSFIDFVQGLLNLNPIERWSPQQAKLHPFITGEPLTKPYVPASGPKTNASSPALGSQSITPVETKRPYGGLPPAPARQATRTYPDAASYNQHLNQQQAYSAMNAANAYRASQIPMNPYADQAAHNQQQQQQVSKAPPPLSSIQQLMNMQNFQGYAQAAQAQSQPPPLTHRTSASMVSSSIPANPPAVHHYPSRGRSLTIGQLDAVPPQLQKLGVDLSSIAGQSMTPVLRRDDQTEAWERRQDNSSLSRKISVSRQ